MEEEDFRALRARYLVSGREESQEGRPHLQMYMEFHQPVRFAHIKKVLGDQVHCAPARGSADENYNYCTKGSGTVAEPRDWDFVEFGDPASGGQGRRNDLLTLRDALASGKRGKDLLDDDATASSFFKYQRGIDAAIQIYDRPAARSEILVEFYFGEGGVGKTHAANEKYPNAYWKDNTKWWAGYAGQTEVIWDEFTGASTTPTEFNKVCDKYPHQVEVKGGHVALRATKIIIISNYTPGTWWNSERAQANLGATTRRLHRIFHFRELRVAPVQYDSYAAFDRALRGVTD